MCCEQRHALIEAAGAADDRCGMNAKRQSWRFSSSA